MKKILSFLIIILLQYSCSPKDQFNYHVSGEANLQYKIDIRIDNINKTQIDKVQVFLDNQKLTEIAYTPHFSIEATSPFSLGKHQLKIILIREGEKINEKSFPIEVYAGLKPKVYTYKLIKTYPHDPKAFTQGLEFHLDTLYEGTGLNGHSSLRKTNYKTGKILKKIDLEKKYFGEGLSILNDKVYQLTWQSGKGFVYDLNFNKIKDFPYEKSKEGWGLCNDGKLLYKSDGTEKIWILNPESLKEETFINVYTDKHKIKKINELEWVDGKIFTNVWMKNALAIINPKTGEVTGIINLSGLIKELNPNIQHDVLNGIAYHKKNKHLFVTGKFWDKMFEIELPLEIFKQ